MIKLICIGIITIISFSLYAQKLPVVDDALNTFGFTEQRIISNSDTIIYYLKNYVIKPDNLVVFIQGTDPYPVFFYQIRKDGTTNMIKWFNDDYKTLDPTYAYAIIAKPGLGGIFNRDNFSVPEKYHKNNYKEYRVNQIHRTIDHIKQHHLNSPKKIIVYGHSEGAQIAANLATVNKDITHLGFWSGNVLNNFYEFALFERIAALKKNQTDSAAHANIEGLIQWYQNVLRKPLSTEIDQAGYTNRRWSSYEEAPISDLLKTDIPVYAVFATRDESTPIETAYLLPIQFMQNRKDNLTFEVCMNCDHSYRENKNGKMINHWPKIFANFIIWTK
jgi:pimeloyl-ACP methyl ester carboxylesterase